MKISKTCKYNYFKVKQTLCFIALIIGFANCKNPKKKQIIRKSFHKEWQLKDSILKAIKLPEIPDRIFNITDYGAKGDGTFDNSAIFKKVITKCANEGGGKIIVPEGQFLTTPIHLDNNINLHISENAEILFSKKIEDYPIVQTAFEGNELMNFSPLIYANNKQNIAITGKGILNGQASNTFWWPWRGRTAFGWKIGQPKQNSSVRKLKEDLAENNVPIKDRVFGVGEYIRPTFIEPFECTNVLIKDITIINSPFWALHPFRSKSVTIDGVKIKSHGPNNNGCNPEYSKNVVIKNCFFDTGDDCISIKSGRNKEGRRVGIKSENIVIENCKMKDGSGAIVIGSEISAGIKNIYVDNCEMSSPNLDRAFRIKTNTKRGGIVENVYIRNITIGYVKEAVLKINLRYGPYTETGSHMHEIKNIVLENITVENGGKFGILSKGYEEKTIDNITLQNVTIKKVESPYYLEGINKINFYQTYINGKLIENFK